MNKQHSAPITNARLEAQIWTTYTLNPYLRVHELHVEVLDGKATLRGDVAEDVEKELAGAIAAGVSGIKQVENQIVVNERYQMPKRMDASFGELVEDIVISTAIKSKLLWSKHGESMDTKVVTTGGKVVLSGTVSNADAIMHAERLAAGTKGVKSVKNRLEISPLGTEHKNNQKQKGNGNMVEDGWITTKVKSTFLYSSNVASHDISVNTNNGEVTLSGKVDSGAQQALAVELAENIRGVKRVDASQLVY
jgi:osmotically-inducible protein OsmY